MARILAERPRGKIPGFSWNRPMTEPTRRPRPVRVPTWPATTRTWSGSTCEMTGLDPETDRLLEIAVVVTGPDLSLRVEGPVIAVHQSDEVLDAMDAWNKGTHGRSGLIDRVKASHVTEAEAEAAGDRLHPQVRCPKALADVRQQHRPGPPLHGQATCPSWRPSSTTATSTSAP